MIFFSDLYSKLKLSNSLLINFIISAILVNELILPDSRYFSKNPIYGNFY